MIDNQNTKTDNTDDGLNDLFRKTLGGQEVEPSVGVWKGISRRLLRAELARFNFTNVPRAFWIGATGLVLVGAFFLVSRDSDKNSAVTVREPAISGKVAPVTSPAITSGNTVSGTSGSNASTPAKASVPARPHAMVSAPAINRSPARTTPAKPPVYALNLPAKTTHTGPAEARELEKQTAEEMTPVTAARNQDGTDLNSMTGPGMTAPFTFPVDDTVLRFATPSGVNAIPMRKTMIPQFFTFNIGVSPEISFYRTSSNQYTETNYWLNTGLTYHAGRFSVQTGIGLGYVFDQGSYRVNYKSKDSIGYFTSIIFFTVTPDNQVIYTTKDIPVYDSLQHFADDRTVDRYTYLRVPLLLGYEVFSSGRFSIGIKAGPSLSFLIATKKAQPYIDYPNARLVRVDNNSSERVKMNWDIQATLDLEYGLSKAISIYAQPYYKYYFQPFVENESAPVKDPYSIGIEVGARIHFGQKKVKP